MVHRAVTLPIIFYCSKSQHSHKESPRQRLKRSVSEKLIDKELRNENNERSTMESNKLEASLDDLAPLGIEVKEEKLKSATNLRRCDSEKIIRKALTLS